MTRTGKIITAVIIGIPVLCCLGSVILFNETLKQSGARGEKELQGLRAKGVPTDVKQLFPKSSLPSEKNAATYYAQFMELTKAREETLLIRAIEAGGGRKATPEQKTKADAAFPKLGKEYALLKKATDLPNCEFDASMMGPRYNFPHFAAIRSAAKLLAYQAEWRSKHGDYVGALDSIRRGYRVASHTGDHFLIAMLVQAAANAITTRSFQNVISNHAENRAFLAMARELTLEQDKSLPSIRNAVLGELPLTLNELAAVKSLKDLRFSAPDDGESKPSAPSATENIASGPLRTLLTTELIHAYAELEPQLPKDPNDWKSADIALKAASAKLEKNRNPATVMAQILFPVYDEVGNAIGRLQAERRVTRAGIELLFERASPKGLPASLGKEPWNVDPFTGKSLGYIKRNRGFTVYSVGPDLKDDQGEPRGPNRKTYDIPFAIQ